jgi:2-aminoadipate transaminase
MIRTLDAIRAAPWTRSMRAAALREIHSFLDRPGILSFALGLPAAELLPAEEIARAAARVAGSDPRALQYERPPEALKRHVASLMESRGAPCRPEEIVLTSGAQQAMDLLARLLVGPGDAVLVEETTYEGILQAVEPSRPELLTVGSDPDAGMDVEAVAEILEAGARPAFVYAIPEGHNPLGVSLDPGRRRRLVAAAREHGVPIVEDDAYGLLRYDDGAAPPLRSLDPDQVIFVGSLSKVIAPSLRAGWIAAPEPLAAILSRIKHGRDLDVASFSHRVAAAWLDEGRLPGHLDRLRREYRARRDAMARGIREAFPAGTRFHVPEAGFFVWVELPAGIDAAEALQAAVHREGIAFVPGAACSVPAGGAAARCLRLSFAGTAPALIEEGMARLGRLLGSLLP